jgi:hypothetical protein
MPLRSFLAAVFLSLATSTAQADLVDDMAAFERVFIPALALTNQPQQPAERVARSLRRLAEAWPRMRPAFTGKGEPLEAAARATDRALDEAGRLLAEDRRAEAHEALETIRPAFIEARRANGIDLYVDRLTQFHEVMEELAKAAQGGSAPPELVDRASALWSRAERPGFEAALFAFDEAKYAELRRRTQGERDTLEALRAALERGEPARVRELAGQMKSRFAQIYMMFGDFEGS